MRIGVLGTGDVGKALGTGFVTLGHEVRMGSRDAGHEGARAWAEEAGEGASTGTFAEAAEFGEVVVLATRGVANETVLAAAGPERLAGKVVIDATNPLDFSGGAPRLAITGEDSGGEQVQRLLPDARVVKAFNTVGNAHMFRPDFPGGPPDMPIAGDDEAAKAEVTSSGRPAAESVTVGPRPSPWRVSCRARPTRIGHGLLVVPGRVRFGSLSGYKRTRPLRSVRAVSDSAR